MSNTLTKDIFKKEILKARSICLMGHISPDGDAYGSVLATYNYILGLKAGEPTYIKIYFEELNDKFSFLPGFDKATSTLTKGEKYDLTIVLDCADKGRMGKYIDAFMCSRHTIVIDHHFTNEGFGDEYDIEPEASSASEVVFKYFDKELINEDIAICIYTGIIHDTGVFRYSSTGKRTMEIAGECMSYGFDFGSIIEDSFFAMSFNQKKVLGYVLSKANIYEDGKVIISFINWEEREKLNAEETNLDGMIDNLRSTSGVEMAVFIYETADRRMKCSLRSDTDRVDVSAIAISYGGGGHKRAAGCFVSKDMDKTTKELIDKYREQVK